METLLVVDDEYSARESFRIIFKDRYKVILAEDGEKALKILEEEPVDVMILDILMPDMDGLEVLKRIQRMENKPIVIVVTAVRSIKTAVEAMKLGAYDYITKPFDVDEMRLVVSKAIENHILKKEVNFLRDEVKKAYSFHNIIGKSKVMEEVFETIAKVMDTDSTVLIQGESGTGKELVARAIHYEGKRKRFPFVAVHCAALPDTLMESELFGHEKGAFTGATERRIGRFELAHRGTLFLDEVSEMSVNVQSKLLRVLEEKEFMRVGGTKPVKVDVRVITATNQDLEKKVKEGTFREDLYYRINVVPIYIPPLRERKEDIPLLVEHFLKKFTREVKSTVKEISPEALEILMEYSWPGNVRELENTIERLVVLVRDSEVILPEHLPENIRPARKKVGISLSEKGLEETINEIERDLIIQALNKTNWVQTKAAKLLGTTRRILKYRMDKLKIFPPDKRKIKNR